MFYKATKLEPKRQPAYEVEDQKDPRPFWVPTNFLRRWIPNNGIIIPRPAIVVPPIIEGLDQLIMPQNESKKIKQVI
jgi:hypothetical protein